MQQTAYNDPVSGKENQMCLHANERKSETVFGGFSAETTL